MFHLETSIVKINKECTLPVIFFIMSQYRVKAKQKLLKIFNSLVRVIQIGIGVILMEKRPAVNLLLCPGRPRDRSRSPSKNHSAEGPGCVSILL